LCCAIYINIWFFGCVAYVFLFCLCLFACTTEGSTYSTSGVGTSSPLMAGGGGHISPGVPMSVASSTPNPPQAPSHGHQGSLTVLQPVTSSTTASSSPTAAAAYTVLPSFGQYAGKLMALICTIAPRHALLFFTHTFTMLYNNIANTKQINLLLSKVTDVL
jgi:hypothetical protein